MKKILFISALDFKEKSIQVIINTPVAFAEAGWSVDYIVARDTCSRGNYYYEQEISPNKINVHRIYWPFPRMRAAKNRFLGLVFSKISSAIVVWKLYKLANKVADNHDVIYGYEMHGVLALGLMKLLRSCPNAKTVSRFQGSFLYDMMSRKEFARLAFNLDQVLAIRLSTNLLIMTDDGTRGDKAVKIIKGNKPYNMYFSANGVNPLTTDSRVFEMLSKKHRQKDDIILLTISRLVGWKRVDRSLELLYKMRQITSRRVILLIVGEGPEREELERRAEMLGLSENVVFIGAVANTEIGNYYALCDFFVSMYDFSNVGNPLLEAIQSKCIVVTLNNGDTGSWVRHKQNGLIYDIDSNFIIQAATDICETFENSDVANSIVKQVTQTANEKLTTWHERLSEEIQLVSNLKGTEAANAYREMP